MAEKSIIPEVIAAASNRRSFVRKIGLASAAAGAALAGASSARAQGGHPNDTDILNFALNLEYLEAEFYTVATTGETLAQRGFHIGGTGTPGPTTGGKLVKFPNDSIFTAPVAQELAGDEQKHVRLLRMALGASAVAKPAINLDALGFGFNSQAEFLMLARIFEDIGVTAYAGAAPLITSSDYLQTAAQILAVEALHSGNIRLQVARLGIMTMPLDSVDIVPPPSGSEFFTDDPTNALAAVRTPGQVLYLAYGNAPSATSGGFFPNGTNGYFNTSSSEAA